MSDTSEEKSEPASNKKMRDARKKGQVQRSQDFVSAVVLLGCSLYLLTLPAHITAYFEQMSGVVALVYEQPFGSVLASASGLFGDIVLETVLPLMAIVLSAVVLGNVTVTLGFIFAMDPISPDFNRINPAKGFTRIVSFRSAVEFLKMIAKLTSVAAVLVTVLLSGVGALVQAPSCGGPCMQQAFFSVLRPLLIGSMSVFGLLGLIDIILQKWLFARDQRMTKTEVKRERKDSHGDPLLRKARNKQRVELGGLQARTDLVDATLIIGTHDRVAVAIRYKRGETPVPFVVARARGTASRQLLGQAAAYGIAIHGDQGLAAEIAKRGRPGEPIPENCFQRVADILVAARLL